MEIKVNYLDNLRQEAKFDDFSVIADQPIRYKGDGSAPGPFDYFLASSALCAAYFVKVYCAARDIPTDNIRLSQNNIVDPENRSKTLNDTAITGPINTPLEIFAWASGPAMLLAGGVPAWTFIGIYFGITLLTVILSKQFKWWYTAPLDAREAVHEDD